MRRLRCFSGRRFTRSCRRTRRRSSGRLFAGSPSPASRRPSNTSWRCRVNSARMRRAWFSSRPTSVLSIVRDLTDAKRAANALEQSRYFAQRLAETIPHVVFLYDLTEQRNVYVNERSASVLGYTAQEVMEMGNQFVPRTMHPDDLAQLPRLNDALRPRQGRRDFRAPVPLQAQERRVALDQPVRDGLRSRRGGPPDADTRLGRRRHRAEDRRRGAPQSLGTAAPHAGRRAPPHRQGAARRRRAVPVRHQRLPGNPQGIGGGAVQGSRNPGAKSHTTAMRA